MKVYLNDEKKSVDPRLHLKRVDSTDRKIKPYKAY